MMLYRYVIGDVARRNGKTVTFMFTQDSLETRVSTKRKEHDALGVRPHSYEFFPYDDA